MVGSIGENRKKSTWTTDRMDVIARPTVGALLAALLALLASPSLFAAGPAPVSDGFRELRLGMSLAAAEKALSGDTYFDYHKPDVSMLPKPDDNLIECPGYTFIRRAYFQFHDKLLYIITLVLNPTELDFYTMYTTLVAKYGQPTSLNPQEVVWESSDYRLSLEHPLSVKWVDRRIFDEVKAAGKMRESARAVSRAEFLQQF